MDMVLPLVVLVENNSKTLVIGKFYARNIWEQADTLEFQQDSFIGEGVKRYLKDKYGFEGGDCGTCYLDGVTYEQAKEIVEDVLSKLLELVQSALDELNRWQSLGFKQII